MGWDQEKEELIDYAVLFRYDELVWITLSKHRNIVKAFLYYLDERYRPFIIMEYMEGNRRYGVSLRKLLKKEK